MNALRAPWSTRSVRSMLGPLPGSREIRVASWATLLVTGGLVVMSLVFAARGRSFLGHLPGSDFLQFYAAGRILNESPHFRLYDAALQYRLHHELLPEMSRERSLVYANAPFLALLFRPFARLPYLWSYCLWMAVTAALYVAGLKVLWPPKTGAFAPVSQTAFLVCLSFSPFALESFAGGQLSAVGFLALALCTRWRSRYPVAAGAALSVCLYKPTLLVLLTPALLIGRRFRALAGFACGALVMAALSLLAVGSEGCLGYVRTLRLYAGWTTGTVSPLPLYKYVDLRTFLGLLLGPGAVASAATLILAAGAFGYLAVRWARSRPGSEADSLLWAATIAWTLVFNLYVPIYDTLLIVVSALIMAGVVYGSRAEPHRPAFLGWMLAVYIAAWLSQGLALFAHIQVFTLVLAAVGAFALRLSRRVEAEGVRSGEESLQAEQRATPERDDGSLGQA